MGTRDVFDSLSVGDRVLYNEKKTPLTVQDREDGNVHVEGPKGGEYVLHVAEDNPELVLVSKHGSERYASKVTELRTVGEWEKTGDREWTHSQTAAVVSVVENDIGYWILEIDAFDGELPDQPKYGFMEEEKAVEEAEAFITEHPEGR